MKELLQVCPALTPLLEDAQDVAALLWQKGWAERNAGNLSVDVTGDAAAACEAFTRQPRVELPFAYPDLAGRLFLVTGSGRRYRDLARNAASNSCLLQLTGDGAGFEILWGGEAGPGFQPTSEFPSHLRVHEHLRQSNAPQHVVLHTHPTELIALTHLPEYTDEAALQHALWSTHPEVKVTVPKGVGLVPYTAPGTEEIAQKTVEVFRRGLPIAVWTYHGCVAIHTSIPDAFDWIDTVNKAAAILLLCRQAGHTPAGLSRDQLDELVRLFDLEE
ncbi:MAG: rhamnulose-1-phosphate aldolase [Candidatus Lernaella stagnicola]|nr:rhamnulose-1-phosphate aldolase [Candidatus Lernaella stagnicola]